MQLIAGTGARRPDSSFRRGEADIPVSRRGNHGSRAGWGRTAGSIAPKLRHVRRRTPQQARSKLYKRAVGETTAAQGGAFRELLAGKEEPHLVGR